MDQITPFRTIECEGPPPSQQRRSATRLTLSMLALAAFGGALISGYYAGLTNQSLPPWMPASVRALLDVGQAPVSADRPIAYYRDPDGRPAYSLTQRKTDDGRDYLPVHVGEDVSFEDQPVTPVPSAGVSPGGRRIKYYRNPMGLPDTSPVPKKDSMGMEYIPVYEGEAEDASTVTVPPGKLQRTGVRSEIVERRVVTDAVEKLS